MNRRLTLAPGTQHTHLTFLGRPMDLYLVQRPLTLVEINLTSSTGIQRQYFDCQ